MHGAESKQQRPHPTPIAGTCFFGLDTPRTILQVGELKLFEIQLHTVGFFQIRDRASGLHTVIPKRIEMILEVKAFQK